MVTDKIKELIGEDHAESFCNLFSYIYKDNEDAVNLSFDLLCIAHVWDDVIDGDNPTTDQLNNAFFAATISLPTNPIWGADLAYNLFNIYLKWCDSNTIENNPDSTENDLSMAWMLRSSMYDLFVLIASKLYGAEWALEISMKVRKHYGESLKGFIEEFKNA